MRVNMNKTKVMISGERQMVRQKDVRWPCGVCSKGVGSNSIQCSILVQNSSKTTKKFFTFDVSTSIRGLHQKKLVLGLLLPVLGAIS